MQKFQSFPRLQWREKCIAILPCFNEAARLPGLLSALRDTLPSMLVVDDGSSDDTALCAAQASAHVVRHGTNQGKGAALRTGWTHALQNGFEWALLLDGDGQHSPQDAPKFFECAEKTGAQLIIGNRMQNPLGMPCSRRLANRCMSAILGRMAGCTLPDSQCGFRLIHLPSLRLCGITATHFEIESDLLLSALEAGIPVRFVAIQCIYHRGSKIHPMLDGWRWLAWCLRRRRNDRIPRARPALPVLE